MYKGLVRLGCVGALASLTFGAAALADPPTVGLAGPPHQTPTPAAPANPSAAAEAVLAFYPAAAKAAGVGGSAVIRCRHDQHLALQGCVLVSETPAGQGFGAAALAMAAKSPDNPKLDFADEATQPPEDVEIRFSARPPEISPDVTRMAHSIVKPAIITQPTAAQIQAAYPVRALDDQVEGAAAIDCIVMADGRLARCLIAGETPTGYGFGQAAVDLAPDFVMKPRYVDGEPSTGAEVRVGVRFSSNDPSAPLTLGVKPTP